MSAGLPGLGLGGLFFIFSALLAPFRELYRTSRGRSRPGDWPTVGRQFAQAAMMVAAIDLSLRLVYVALGVAGIGNPPSALSGTVIPLTLIGLTFALLVAVLASAKFADLAVRLRTAELPQVPDARPLPTPLRVLAIGGVVAIAWVALLASGGSESSPLARPQGKIPPTESRAGGAPKSASMPAQPRQQGRTEVSAAAATVVPRRSHVQQSVLCSGSKPNGGPPQVRSRRCPATFGL